MIMKWRWILYVLLAISLAGAALVASQGQEDEDFEPTEKVPADSSVSFPVDI
jgi:hypothetical protein